MGLFLRPGLIINMGRVVCPARPKIYFGLEREKEKKQGGETGPIVDGQMQEGWWVGWSHWIPFI